MLGSNPLYLREKLRLVSYFSNVCHYAKDGVYGGSVSQTFLPVLMYFLIDLWIGIAHLVSGFLSEELPHV